MAYGNLEDFFRKFRESTERTWEKKKLDPEIFGFQIQPRTKWMPPLTVTEIDDFARRLGCKFPEDYRVFLGVMNGADREAINLYGNSGEPPATKFTLYSFPRDIDVIKRQIAYLKEDWDGILDSLRNSEHLNLEEPIDFVPVYGHRYILCPPNKSVICSIVGTDAIIYGKDLEAYLRKEFL